MRSSISNTVFDAARRAAAGGKWAVYDYQAGKTVCCLVVVGPEISEAELDSNYGIPGPWITDLVNGWNLDAAPYRPRVQLLRAEGACSTTNSRTWPTSWAACCCPPRRAVAPRTLELDGQRYSVTRKDVPLASDDGMVHAYALRPAQGGKPWRSRLRDLLSAIVARRVLRRRWRQA